MGDSTFLFAKPSFVEAAARILDFGGTLTVFNNSLSPEQADSIALSMDWQLVGHDFREAIRKVVSEQVGQGVQE
jgi:hypothetical protein